MDFIIVVILVWLVLWGLWAVQDLASGPFPPGHNHTPTSF